MNIVLEEENNYFKHVVKDAVNDLKKHKQAYVFFEEQVQAVKSILQKEILVEEEDGFYYLTLCEV